MNSYLFNPDIHTASSFSPLTDGRPPSTSTDPGKSNHHDAWAPFSLKRLPGVQVVITAHNAAAWLHRCLASVEMALEGYRWILVFVDDGSTDDTLKLAVNHPSRAYRTILRTYPKAANVSVAKNRAFALTHLHAKEFPAIVPMDADDEMTRDRVRHLLPAAIRGRHRVVMGDYLYVCPEFPDRHHRMVPARAENVDLGIFGPPMTLFHVSLLPADGVLFREDLAAYSDAALWHAWKSQGIEIQPVPGKVIHHYHYREGSTSNPRDKAFRRENIERYQAAKNGGAPKPKLASPLVSALMITGKCDERYALARVAVRCFFEQTWESKELIVINHGGISLATGDPRLREIRVERTPDMTLGDLRNLALENASGEYLIQWDDDDFHDPQRMATMMAYRDQAEVVTIGWQIRFNLLTGSAYYHHLPGGQQMAILHRANLPYRYPFLNSREDTLFLGQFNSRFVIDNAPGEPVTPLLYVRLFHGRNIWDEAHVMEHLAGAESRMEIHPEHQAALRGIEAVYRASEGFSLPAIN